MAVDVPVLNFTIFDLHNPGLLGVVDYSSYPTGMTPVSPSLSVTVPGFGTRVVPFTPKSLQILNSNILGITCEDECTADLPDGIYKIRYTISPAYKYYADRTFIRVERLWQKFDQYFLGLKLKCNSYDSMERKQLEEIELWIQGAIAAANNCATDLAMELYHKASVQLDKLLKNG